MRDCTIIPLERLPQKSVETAILLYWRAFRDKLGLVLGPEDKAFAILRRAVRASHALVAVGPDGCIVGVAGFRSREGSFVHLAVADLVAVHGPVAGRLRYGLLALLGTDIDNRRFLIDGLAVAEDCRGRGIGSALIAALATMAREGGYDRIRLDVADHNIRARALYERLGFRATGHQRLWLLAPFFRMRGVTVMESAL